MAAVSRVPVQMWKGRAESNGTLQVSTPECRVVVKAQGCSSSRVLKGTQAELADVRGNLVFVKADRRRERD